MDITEVDSGEVDITEEDLEEVGTRGITEVDSVMEIKDLYRNVHMGIVHAFVLPWKPWSSVLNDEFIITVSKMNHCKNDFKSFLNTRRIRKSITKYL